MAKRKRASRGSLSAEAISAAALEIADELGLENLTVRKLADKLGVAPMSVYGHYNNKDEIVGSLLARVIARFEVTDHSDAMGQDWILECFRRIRKALLTHPGVIPLLGTKASVSPLSVQVAAEIVERFSKLGLDSNEAARQFYAMLTFTIGTAHVEHGFQRMLGDRALAGNEKLKGMVLDDGYGDLGAIAPALVQQVNEASFMTSLRSLAAQP